MVEIIGAVGKKERGDGLSVLCEIVVHKTDVYLVKKIGGPGGQVTVLSKGGLHSLEASSKGDEVSTLGVEGILFLFDLV